VPKTIQRFASIDSMSRTVINRVPRSSWKKVKDTQRDVGSEKPQAFDLGSGHCGGAVPSMTSAMTWVKERAH
jgi:hypothetical protein